MPDNKHLTNIFIMSREIFEAKMAELKASHVSIKTKSLQNVDVKDNAQINIVNARKTILVAIASVHVIVETDARTEILNCY